MQNASVQMVDTEYQRRSPWKYGTKQKIRKLSAANPNNTIKASLMPDKFVAARCLPNKRNHPRNNPDKAKEEYRVM